LKKKMAEKKFIPVSRQEKGTAAFVEGSILLYPFKNLSVQPFSFPFSGMPLVRDALKIQLRPLLGEKAEDVSLVPLLTKTEKKSSEGAIFLLYGEEEGTDGNIGGGAKNYAVWPLPLAFAAEINGSGLIIWEDAEQIISLWLREWVPMLYRWSARERAGAAKERELMQAYAEERGETLGDVFITGGDGSADADVQEHGMRTIRAYPAYEHLDLSTGGADLLEQRERTAGLFMKTARGALAAGLLFALISGGLFFQRSFLKDTIALHPENVYALSFGERSRQPLASAGSKLASLQNGGRDASLQGLLRTLGPVWGELPGTGSIVIETLRYSTEKTDLLGTAKDNNSIGRLRALLEERGFSAKTDNIQQVPGGGLRFSLSITRGATS